MGKSKTMAAYAKNKKGMTAVNVPCRGCGNNVGIQLEEGTKAPPMYCDDCKTREGWHTKPVGDEASCLRPILNYTPIHGEVKILRPGDPEFHFAAAQCRHISEIRVAGGMGQPGDASVSRFIV